jgi:adenine-specific DNA-methyltransferase
MVFNKAYNREEFVQFLRNNFLPEDFEPAEEAVTFSTQMKYTSEATKLGTSDTLDLVVYEVKHTSQKDARVALSKEAFRLLADDMQDRALVVFVPKDNADNYRFSFIEISLDMSDDKSSVSRNYSNPRRYSYLLGKDIACYTPNKYLNEKGRVVDDEDLHSRFSVEVLTKEFYSELSDWYAWAIQIIRFPNDINDDTDDAKYNSESAIRMITRLIFVWFLKQRNLIPNEFFDESNVGNLLKGFDPHADATLFTKSKESRYYKAILQNLFFAMLNSPITAEGESELSERHFRDARGDYDNNKLMRYEDYFSNPQGFVDLANKVPFLNGGLFDCLDDKDNGMYYDGFSDREAVRNALVVPDYLFFGDEVGNNIDLSEWYGDKKKKKVSARGIIDILRRYNFTVEENTPFDKEVSLDPELLGKVFENLLASFNPETQTTARKQTGSFYTPREIVQYMVDESLIAHLKRTAGEELEPKLRQLLQYTDDDVELTEEQRMAIMQSLYHCKILDPACGSGAFPMGILQQMVHILGRIDPDNVQWKKMMMQQAVDDTTEAFKSTSKEERKDLIADIERSFDDEINRPDYARKLYLIENCIYGVDIQPIAIQISKLRFFISLVVDQNTNTDPVDNFGIRPLPNLEAKFVAANTLIGLQKNDATLFDTVAIKAKEEELKDAKHKIFSAKTVRTKRKYRKMVNDLRQEIADMLLKGGVIGNDEARQLASWDMFDQNASSPFFDPEWMFGVKDGFDIVIGNPPYLKEGRASKFVFDGVRESKYYQGKMDLWYMFVCYGIDLLIYNGILCFIATNNWVTNSGASKMREKIINDTIILQLNDFSNFMIFESASIQTMVMLFEKDKVSNNYQIDYRKLKGDTVLSDVVSLLAKIKTPRVEFLTPIFNRKNFENKYITFSSNESILDKIANAKNVIYLTNKEVANGIHPHYDFINNKLAEKSSFSIGEGIFGLTSKECEDLNLSDAEKELIKPYYNNSDLVERYYTSPNNKYWIIYTDSTFKDPQSMDRYPNLKTHLDKFSGIITSDNKPYGLHRSREERFFKGEKVIALRKCVGRPLFSYSDFDCYLSATFYVIKTDRLNMKYLTGLLNSKLIQFWLKNRGKMQGINYQLDKEPLVSIPIVSPSKSIQSKIATLVDYIIYLKANPSELVNEYVNNDYIVTVIEDIIDAAIFEIYFPFEFKDKSINIFIDTRTNVSEFYSNIKMDTSPLLKQIKLMKVELSDLLMPILSL